MARENALRDPRRTAATASARMVGLALVATMAVIGESTNESIDIALEDDLMADFVISNALGLPFSTTVAANVARLGGVAEVAQVRWQAGQVAGDDANIAALGPEAFREAVRFDVTSGSTALGRDGALVARGLAEQMGLVVGDRLTVTLPAGERRLHVAGVFDDNPAVGSEVAVGFDTLARGGVRPVDGLVYIVARADADLAAVRTALEQLTAELPTVTIKDQEAFKEACWAPSSGLPQACCSAWRCSVRWPTKGCKCWPSRGCGWQHLSCWPP